MARVPRTFREFRETLAKVLQTANAPPGMVADAADYGYEGGDTFMAIWRTWQDWEPEAVRIEGEETPELLEYFEDCIGTTLHDELLTLHNDQYNPQRDKQASALLARK